MDERKRLWIIILYAAAMAWMEAATVVYLRTLVGRLVPYQAEPLPLAPGLSQTEVVREAATMVIVFTAGWLAGRSWRSRLGYTMVAFGVWDILYYVFLALIGPWPRSVWDWDVLFLIPLPWWGPVLAPTLIAALMVAGGTLLSRFDHPDQPLWPGRWCWGLNLSGVALGLYVFMEDAVRALPAGPEALRKSLPTAFDWPLFLIALVLLSAPLFDLAAQLRHRGIVSQPVLELNAEG